MKLLFTQDALVNAGAERSHLEILSRFSDQIEVTLVYFYPKHDLKEEYEKAGIRLIFLDIPESYHFGLAVARLVKLIKAEKPNLLISCLWRADIITRIASWMTGVPLVGTLVNDSYAPIAWKDKKGLKYKLVYWLDRLTAGIPIHWIANANALAESHVLNLGLDSSKISVVYRGRAVPEEIWGISGKGKRENGDEIGRLDNERKGNWDLGEGIERLDDRQKGNSVNQLNSKSGNLDISGKGKRDLGEGIERIKPYAFISYGRLLERKGFQDVIQAFATVIQKHPNCTLTIYGEGPYRASLESLINRLGLEEKVKLPGTFNSGLNTKQIATSSLGTPRNDDTPPIAIGAPNLQSPIPHSPIPIPQSPNLSSLNLLLSSNCFLFPSWYEGFSGALVEAMMAGIPIIASDIPMNLEAITDQVNGLTFPLGNSAELQTKMQWMIECPDEAKALGVAARKTAIQRFDIEKIAREYEGVLRGITSPRPSL